MKTLIISCALLALLHVSTPVMAGDHGTFSTVIENDVFYGLDRHYTNGIRILWAPETSKDAPGWATEAAQGMPWFGEGRIEHGYSIGQSMYTPRDITIEDPPLDERPYAGWLYASISLGVVNEDRLDQLGLTVGIVGPASQADKTQKRVHRLVDTKNPEGWNTQLENELGIIVSGQRGWRAYYLKTFDGHSLDFTPHVGAALGNVFTYVNAGGTLRFGSHLPNDFGPPRIQPALPGSASLSRTTGLGWYLFAGFEVRGVARNLFLDGNTFKDSRSVDRENLVGDIQFGLVVDWENIRFSYTNILRSLEYDGQDKPDEFGAFAFMWKL